MHAVALRNEATVLRFNMTYPPNSEHEEQHRHDERVAVVVPHVVDPLLNSAGVGTGHEAGGVVNVVGVRLVPVRVEMGRVDPPRLAHRRDTGRTTVGWRS
jgi:hypothetical protein